jgi:hypothetical protein
MGVKQNTEKVPWAMPPTPTAFVFKALWKQLTSGVMDG